MRLDDGELLTEPKVRRLANSAVSAYTMYQTGGTYYAESNLPGGTDYDDADFDTVIQNVLAALTASRTWMEKVSLKGSFTLGTKIELPDYTLLDLYGAYLTLASNTNTGMIIGDDPTGGNEYIGIIGGVLDGNSAGQSSNGSGIWIRNISNSFFRDIHIEDCYAYGFKFVKNNGDTFWNSNNYVQNVYVKTTTTTDPCFALAGCKHTVCDGLYAEDSIDVGINVYGSQHLKISNSTANANAASGFYIEWDSNNSKTSHDIKLVNCTSMENTQHGFSIDQELAKVFDVDFCNCTAYQNDYHGFHLSLSSADYLGATITGGEATNNGQNGSYDGVNLNNTQGVLINGLKMWDNQTGVETQTYGLKERNNADLNIIKNCIFKDNATGAIVLTGVNTKVPTITKGFVRGTEYNTQGWIVDDAADFATLYFNIPADLSELIDLRIWAYSGAAETDAMRLEINLWGATDNEGYGTETIAIADHPSTSTNFSVGDIIYWVIDSSDDSDLGDLAAGDSVTLQVLHEAAGGADCASDAHLRTIEVRYV